MRSEAPGSPADATLGSRIAGPTSHERRHIVGGAIVNQQSAKVPIVELLDPVPISFTATLNPVAQPDRPNLFSRDIFSRLETSIFGG